ncbi:hypothetical protein HDU89_005625 [Geranomyces variabilis]|nr:hypothetical protein HDU89_005625 [Geranomyces variabilis]
MASHPISKGEFDAGANGGGDYSAYHAQEQHQYDPAYADPNAAQAYTEYDYQQWQAYQEAQQAAAASWAGGAVEADYWTADWQQQHQQQPAQQHEHQQPPLPSHPSSSYAAAPVQYSAPPSSSSTTTYGAPATYYAAPSKTSQPASSAAISSTALPARPPPLSARDETAVAGGGVPYPSGYTVESESGAVPYPAGYTPSAATATVVRVRSDEDRKAAALAALPPTPAVAPPPTQPPMMAYQTGTPSSSAAGIVPGAVAGLAGVAAVDSKGRPKKPILRTAGGEAWEDPTLAEWDSKDYRLFCGDLGNEVTDELLLKAFGKYPSVLRARVVRDNRSNKSKGYGFVSFKDPSEFTAAMREINGKYVGNRPIKLRKSTWAERTVDAKTLRKIQQTAIFKPVLKTVTKKEPKKDAAATAAAAAAAMGNGAGMDQYGYGHQQQYPPQGGYYGQ